MKRSASRIEVRESLEESYLSNPRGKLSAGYEKPAFLASTLSSPS